MSGDHWYVPTWTCAECGLPSDHVSHHRRCEAGYGVMSNRPGFGFCRLPDTHDGECEIVWWDGTVTRGNETIEAGKRFG